MDSNQLLPFYLAKYPAALREQIEADYRAILERERRYLLGEVQMMLARLHCGGTCNAMTALRADVDELFITGNNRP